MMNFRTHKEKRCGGETNTRQYAPHRDPVDIRRGVSVVDRTSGKPDPGICPDRIQGTSQDTIRVSRPGGMPRTATDSRCCGVARSTVHHQSSPGTEPSGIVTE